MPPILQSGVIKTVMARMKHKHYLPKYCISNMNEMTDVRSTEILLVVDPKVTHPRYPNVRQHVLRTSENDMMTYKLRMKPSNPCTQVATLYRPGDMYLA